MASLATVVMASSMVLPSAAESAFTPSDSNFVPLFDFDKVPTAKYTAGYEPGDFTKDTIGDGLKKCCIVGDEYGISYTLKIAGGKGYKGLALEQTVTENAPEGGSYDPIGLYCMYGENKNPGIQNGTADALVFWVDFTGFKRDRTLPANEVMDKGFLMTLTEVDYDADGNAQEKSTTWEPKANGSYYLLIDGVWTEKKVTANRDFFITADQDNFCGWVKIPLNQMTYPDTWGRDDVDGKFDGKSIQAISLGSGNYKSQAGSVLYYDEFGLSGNFGETPSSTTDSTPATTDTNGSETSATASTAVTTIASGINTTATTVGALTTGGTTIATDTTAVVNPKTGVEKGIGMLGAAALIAAGAIVVSRKKTK